MVAFCRAVGLARSPTGHAPTAVVRRRGLSREVLDRGLRCIQRLIIACGLEPRRLLLLAIVLRRSLRARSRIVGVLAAALVAFVLLIAVLRDLHQAPVRGIRIRLVRARYAAVCKITVLIQVVYLLLLHIMRLGASTGSIHQVHIVTLVLLEFALLLLLGRHALIHLIGDVQGNFLVGSRMRVEKLVGLLGTEQEDPILQILLLELRHLLVHDECLSEVLELSLALALDLRVDLDEYLQITRHHVGQRIATRLHLLQRVVDILYLLLPL